MRDARVRKVAVSARSSLRSTMRRQTPIPAARIPSRSTRARRSLTRTDRGGMRRSRCCRSTRIIARSRWAKAIPPSRRLSRCCDGVGILPYKWLPRPLRGLIQSPQAAKMAALHTAATSAAAPAAARVGARPPAKGEGALYRFQEISDTKIRQKIDNLHTVMQQLPRRALV